MFKALCACLVTASAALVMTSAVLSAPLSNLPLGSTVYITSMDGFDRYFRAAVKGVDMPLVFVRTRAQAAYEVTGTTKEVRADVERANGATRTTRQDTTIWIKNTASGETVFTHSVQTAVNSPNRSQNMIERAARRPTPTRLLVIGRETAARECAEALRNALKEKP